MAESQSTSALAAEEDDSDWEYEYHETETESFYVTLDISSAANYKNPRTKTKELDPPPPATSIAPTTPAAQENADPSEPPESPVPEALAPMDVDQIPDQSDQELSPPEPTDHIQVLDLHTQNPLISYQNQMYSCEWTSTLGTDLLLTTPAPNFPHPVLRDTPNVFVLAASSIKLMGRPAQIATRQRAEEGDEASTPAPENSTASANTASSEKATPVKIPLGATPSRARQNQANFLERLIAIKAKKGDKDSVTVYTQKVNQGTGWRSQRKASEVIEDGEDEITPKRSRRGRGTGGRPRGSRRTKGPRTAKGGLFRDYRPQLWDTPGADIRAGPSSTPESWDHLEGGASDGRQTPTTATTNASPSRADQPVQPANRSPQSLSASASAKASPTPSIRPVQSRNGEPSSSYALATPSPSLALALGLQPAVVREESVVPASEIPNAETPQQEQTEGVIAEQSTSALDTVVGISHSSGMAAAGDVEMEDV
ncbi:MAG: hypothetical protein ASARMPREDX12_002304 [Alectoria sarmentosa]|nr:MAG: hypothetical protein ASARMPREDX12_002304 [Alectoria sarmentosa]